MFFIVDGSASEVPVLPLGLQWRRLLARHAQCGTPAHSGPQSKLESRYHAGQKIGILSVKSLEAMPVAAMPRGIVTLFFVATRLQEDDRIRDRMDDLLQY